MWSLSAPAPGVDEKKAVGMGGPVLLGVVAADSLIVDGIAGEAGTGSAMSLSFL